MIRNHPYIQILTHQSINFNFSGNYRIPKFHNPWGDSIVDFAPVGGRALPFQISQIHYRLIKLIPEKN